MSAREYCPQCGEPRIGSFRFCRGCRFDFDAVIDASPITTPAIAVAAEPPAATRRGLLDLVGRTLAVAWVATFLGGCIWLVVTIAPGADLISWLLVLVLVPAWLGISIVPFGAIGMVIGAGIFAKEALTGRPPDANGG